MHLEELAEGSSLLHRLDPRVKIVSAVVFAFAAAPAQRMAALWLFLAAGAALVLLARMRFGQAARRLLPLLGFLALFWVFLPFSQPGEAVFRIGPLTATREGLLLAQVITMKSLAVILAIMALLSTSTVFQLVHAMRHLHMPDTLVHLFFLTFRYFQVIHGEYARLRTAMRVRGFRPRTDRHTYQSLAWLVGMVLVRSFDRSERVYQAMRCRGYDGRLWVLHHFHLHGRDIGFAVAFGVVVLGLVFVSWLPNL